ncbi:CDP-6-deoxy-delta-3,4-glucoseen reductase [Polynucleobacter sphagniphilus]|uniref:CDP-4-dehydro-6-deoxyglucose reductase n=1 Tax=Polynucleobacter sphagniphilus TaxID=1743169 RepID=A0AA43M6V5_9BURK|nr:CDP-6-deoxy-delta-3,4-glucoseen reductase [Polynucleobacter sphagniphilus]MDF9788744.1 CDP-4-dehydro-6-deoxyglucose reductase [Polynucleobacter sphagniphilus]MDH6155343.1 CDP-4-dehydro-6-deoxyglucose reductase [Polynucleobacter sphagniphilus]MDH6249248.1 CDP-4-dehydro-6-deoxyglucose reductase [Polynucleobacter sphagniphilus]MDH6503040.1 CDP-4-dehydro-6-deoxyglucose reductase [Polynucleobacter sphagniphilus]MDH6511701.1 CDP-4-dehydro-6-deoxyglucose reductase [Polynucleobacter sphagniphilus]
MSYQVTLKTSGKQFTVDSEESILEAALRQGINLPYGCKNGACGSCKGKVLEGQLSHGQHSEGALSRAEETAGSILFCCAHPQSDLLIEAREVQGSGDIAIRKIPCRVNTITKPSADVAILKLQLPAAERFQFLAGQYLEFLLKDGQRRAYSIANAPEQEGPLELHIRHLPGGLFTDFVFGVKDPALKEKDILRFEGPLGSFFLREDSKKPIIFVAAGTGFAPIKSIIEQMQLKKIARPVYLYWGGRRPGDLYLPELCASWEKEIANFKYIPVISDAQPEDQWQGRTGFVHQAVMQDHPDMKDFQVYACGAPIMVNSARTDFSSQCHLPEEEFFADSFTSAADLAS